MTDDAKNTTCSHMEAQGVAEKKHCGPEHSKHEDSLQAWHFPVSGRPEEPSSRTQINSEVSFAVLA